MSGLELSLWGWHGLAPLGRYRLHSSQSALALCSYVHTVRTVPYFVPSADRRVYPATFLTLASRCLAMCLPMRAGYRGDHWRTATGDAEQQA